MHEIQVVDGMALTLQLGTAVYALRLNRLFGSQRAGWSLFGAFALMLAVHLSEASDALGGPEGPSDWMPQLIYLSSSALLFIGLAHVGMIFRERLRAEEAIRTSHEALEERVRERTAELAEANASLQSEIQDRQRAQIEKLESISRLAGGMAHDFNNILTIIQGHAAYALTLSEVPEPARESLTEVQLASERAAQLTRQLVAVGRGQTVRPEPLDLSALVRRTLDKQRRTLGDRIRVQIDCGSTPVVVKADPAMIEQVLTNLIANAREAMPAGGDLRLLTRVVRREAHMAEGRNCPAGQYACLTVTDTGCGIAAEILPRIFEPFFTTKDVGQGAGLGLATVQGVVRQHHGWVEVASPPGHGTTFDVYLPATKDAIASSSAAKPASTSPVCGLSHRTVLLVEDDGGLRKLAHRILSGAGYNIVEADSGVAALSQWEKHRDKIDLLFTDIVMPQGMNGWDLTRKLKTERPTLKVLCTSGYVPERIRGEPGIRLLAKPYDGRNLLQAVEGVLRGE